MMGVENSFMFFWLYGFMVLAQTDPQAVFKIYILAFYLLKYNVNFL